jgi:hypothetical protein
MNNIQRRNQKLTRSCQHCSGELRTVLQRKRKVHRGCRVKALLEELYECCRPWVMRRKNKRKANDRYCCPVCGLTDPTCQTYARVYPELIAINCSKCHTKSAVMILEEGMIPDLPMLQKPQMV